MTEDEIVRIIPPSPRVIEIYELYTRMIKSALPAAHVRLIGSFAVPMKGKSELDILVETDDVVTAMDALAEHSFSKGPIIDREGYMHCRKYELLCEVHLVRMGDKKIAGYVNLVKTLQKDEHLRKEYEALKESCNGKTKAEYRIAKNAFLREHKLV
ncbi:MAG: GrpB family protein [Nanoarchaeota archaeon]